MDLPLYTTVSRTKLSDLGSTGYHLFDVLDQVMRQAGQHADQRAFRDLLTRLRNAESTVDDWRLLMKRTPAEVGDVSAFDNALRLFPTTEAVVAHTVCKLRAARQPQMMQSLAFALHMEPESQSDALCQPVGWGGFGQWCHRNGHCHLLQKWPVSTWLANSSDDSYSGPTLPDGTVPIIPLRRTWFNTTKQCSRLQLPLKLAFGRHHPQGPGSDTGVVIDVGKKEPSLKTWSNH